MTTFLGRMMGSGATQTDMTDLVQYLADIGAPLDEKDGRGRTPIQTGDVIPLDQPIQRMAEIIVSRGGTPVAFPKEYVKPVANARVTWQVPGLVLATLTVYSVAAPVYHVRLASGIEQGPEAVTLTRSL